VSSDKLELVGQKSAFSIQGEDRVGAVAEIAARLAKQ
jgi:predicted amino acid-binding ACT domain protein